VENAAEQQVRDDDLPSASGSDGDQAETQGSQVDEANAAGDQGMGQATAGDDSSSASDAADDQSIQLAQSPPTSEYTPDQCVGVSSRFMVVCAASRRLKAIGRPPLSHTSILCLIYLLVLFWLYGMLFCC
jgi:hypothetical protein